MSMTTTDINEEFSRLNKPSPNDQFCWLMRMAREGDYDGARLSDSEREKAEALIDGGLDYRSARAVAKLTRAVLGHVIEEQMRISLLGRMIRHGYNPLRLAANDWERLQKDYNTQGSNTKDQLTLLAGEAETRGEGFRDDKGGNFFHMLAQYSPGTLASYIFRMTQPPRQGSRDPAEQPHLRASMLAWVSQQREDGSTPMHTLWSPETMKHAYRLNREWVEGKDEGMEDSLNNTSVYLTSNMIKLGGDLLLPNKQGIRVLDLMDARKLHANKTKHTQEYGEKLGIMLAHAQARILTQDTPVARGVARGMPRL